MKSQVNEIIIAYYLLQNECIAIYPLNDFFTLALTFFNFSVPVLESEDSEEISEELETTESESEPTTTESETKTAKRKNLRENLTLKLSLQFSF